MIEELACRKAALDDLFAIIELILENDELAKSRESDNVFDQAYIDAFHKINNDSNHYLMVTELNSQVVGVCHLTLIPSLSFVGSTRLQIETVRVREKYREHGIGEWMMRAAINYGIVHGASIVQLTTNKKRARAKSFYERLGFEATHEGMKLYIKKA
ncbi:MAG: GNAT family N-acetyltransferase [Pseudomonadota bacterium]|nr:GNAT family N-acetyltransferase [Alphaproteobacteria bacterium]MDP5370126.1 GNAT family N-acetyltransferase [Pseudomonadota bacterium]